MPNLRHEHTSRNKSVPHRKARRARVRWYGQRWAPGSQIKSKSFAREADARAFAARFAQWKADHDQPLAWIEVEVQGIAILAPWREIKS